LLQRHALLSQFLLCFLVLGQVHQAHPTQHIGRLGELDVVVTDDLYSITPGVPKIKERTVKWGNTSCLDCLAGRLLVVDDETEVTTIVCGLLAALLQGNELIAQVDERHGGTLANASSISPTSNATWLKPMTRGFANSAIGTSFACLEIRWLREFK